MIDSITYPTLYHTNSNGTVYQWTIWTEQNRIITEYGTVGGQLQRAEKAVFPKNVGRSNETTGPQQAASEAQSMWQLKKTKKYTETLGEVHEFEAPMLADSWDKHKAKISYPVNVQPKLDGIRAILRHNGETFELWSRGGKLITTCPHIIEEANEHIDHDAILDGELYVHGLEFQDITRLVKKQRGESILVQFYAFDIVTNGDFRSRVRELMRVLARHSPKHFVVVHGVACDNETEVNAAHSNYVAEGYEGSIIRSNQGLYIFGKRSKNVLKKKDFLDQEYRVIGYTIGQGKFEQCPIYICETEDGQTFNVAPRGNTEYRRHLLDTANLAIGKSLTVRFQELTMDGIPRFPVGIAIREDWDNS